MGAVDDMTDRVAELWRSQGDGFLERHHALVLDDVARLRGAVVVGEDTVEDEVSAEWHEKLSAAVARMRRWDDSVVERIRHGRDEEALNEAQRKAARSPGALVDLTGPEPVVTASATSTPPKSASRPKPKAKPRQVKPKAASRPKPVRAPKVVATPMVLDEPIVADEPVIDEPVIEEATAIVVEDPQAVIPEPVVEDEVIEPEVVEDDVIEPEVVEDDVIQPEVVEDDVIQPEVEPEVLVTALFDGPDLTCKRCQETFDSERLVYPHGELKPPLCITCAREVAGFRPRSRSRY